MNRLVWVVSATVLLSACSSSVKLDPPSTVEERPTTTAPSVSTSTPPVTTTRAPVKTVDAPVVAPAVDAALATKVVYFDYDSSVIRDEFQPAIEAHARWIKADKSRKVMLEGHTDERGGREYNLALGQRRAESVRRALALLGVADNQVEAVSFGEEKPAAMGAGEESMAKNRRVEINQK